MLEKSVAFVTFSKTVLPAYSRTFSWLACSLKEQAKIIKDLNILDVYGVSYKLMQYRLMQPWYIMNHLKD